MRMKARVDLGNRKGNKLTLSGDKSCDRDVVCLEPSVSFSLLEL